MKTVKIIILLLLAATAAFWPCLFLVAENKTLLVTPIITDVEFTINFIHSVQKTPVWENLTADRQGFTLRSTKYRSFGVGLPFLESEGDFRHEGDYYVMDNMNRHFDNLSLRTGVGTNLTVYVEGNEYRLYEMFPPGTKADVFIAPLYKRIF